MVVLIFRLYFIQMIGHEELSQAAMRQQRIRLDGIDSRGIIYDRNDIALTSNNREYVYIIPTAKTDSELPNILKRINARKMAGYNANYGIYSTNTYYKELTKSIIEKYNAYVIVAERRYEHSQIAAHLIGYVNPSDSKGVSGIEKTYDEILSLRENRIYAVADVNGNIMRGHGLSCVSENVGSGLKLTIDMNIQEKIEEILSRQKKYGAVVVLKSDTGEILGAASTPSFNPNQLNSYMDSKNKELINKVTQGQYPPGSIFKIVVLAAALENENTDDKGNNISEKTIFNCKGYEEIGHLRIGCSTGGEKGHQDISLENGFAKSCNSVFIQLGKNVGGDKIIQMAEKFGLGKIPIDDIPNIKKGRVTAVENTVGAGIGNLSIGQGDLEVTPLQVAKLTNIIANEGIDKGIYLVINEEKTGFNKKKRQEKIISEETGNRIKYMMEKVMVEGTGRGCKIPCDIAGKTGSAEDCSNGEEVVHGWFTGFFPSEKPQYTITVFIENGGSGRGSALPIFEEVANYIIDLYPINENKEDCFKL